MPCAPGEAPTERTARILMECAVAEAYIEWLEARIAPAALANSPPRPTWTEVERERARQKFTLNKNASARRRAQLAKDVGAPEPTLRAIREHEAAQQAQLNEALGIETIRKATQSEGLERLRKIQSGDSIAERRANLTDLFPEEKE